MLEGAYGDAFLTDYKDNPANPLSQRVIDSRKYFARGERLPAGIKCIHGHFHPGKFDLSGDVILATMLRHPVDNILSIYFFWKTMKREDDPLHDYFLDNNLTIIETAQLPLLRRLYSKTYFEGFDMDRFDLIGRHSDREHGLKKLSERIGTPLDINICENVTAQSEARIEACADRALLGQLEDILVDDIRFYERYTQRCRD
jgi:hypothetical protein